MALPTVVPKDDLPSNIVPDTDLPAAPTSKRDWGSEIDAAATKYGVDARILRRLIQQESGGNPQAVSPTGARGLAQFMPETAKQYGVNVDDPASSIDGAARYFSDLQKRFKGNVRMAAAAYNAGPGAVEKYGGVPPFKETQNYVAIVTPGPDKVPASDLPGSVVPASDLPGHSAPTRPGPNVAPTDVHHFSTPSGGGGQDDLLHRGWRALLTAGTDVSKGADAVLGAPQRVTAGTLTGGLGHGIDVAAHPFDDAKQQAQEKATEALPGVHQAAQAGGAAAGAVGTLTDQLMHFVGHETHNQEFLRKIGTTLAAQIITDPTTIIPIVGQLGKINKVRKIVEEIRAVTAAAGTKIPGIEHLQKATAAFHDNELVKSVHHYFGVRTELDKFLDDNGKAAYLSIENKHHALKYEDPAERSKAVADEFAKYLAEHGGYKGQPIGVTGGAGDVDALHKFTKMLGQVSRKEAESMPKDLPGAGIGRKLGKYGVMLNPLPHGLKNVGELAFLAGGPEAFGSGMVYTAKGLAQPQEARLRELGLDIDYLHEASDNKLDTAMQAFTKPQQQLLNRMEKGYRQALLDQFDKTLGPSRDAMGRVTNLPLEYKKAQMVRDALGDYRNVSRFVNTLKALGGPFVAFRAGIVPKAVGRAALKRPDRLEMIERTQSDVNDELGREGAGYRWDVGGPAEDFGRMIFKPVDYLTSPASVGALGAPIQAVMHHATGEQLLGQLAGEYIPGERTAAPYLGMIPPDVRAMAGFDQNIDPSDFPYKKPPGVSAFMEAMASAFGTYYHKPLTDRRRAEIRKGIM